MKAIRFYYNLLSTTAKLEKSSPYGYLTRGLSLFPDFEICPFASSCMAVCVNQCGNGWRPNVKKARQWRTNLFKTNKPLFFEFLDLDIAIAKSEAKYHGLKLAIRLNTFSDIDFKEVIAKYPDITFYDYTKDINKHIDNILPNYFLLLSRSEKNDMQVDHAIQCGKSISVVFDVRKNKPMPKVYRGLPVIDGDQHDLFFLHMLEGKQFILGLKAKGKAQKDQSGFVVR